ncbi:hypothetical protein BGY98DRAFT_509337 [Russula aff. rugulosa BPL654]|nr:hypothetical protein BGY98DRAFT_509337 [Russula aff. rugulosa BPL654]
MTRQAFHTRSWTPWILSSLAEFSIRDTIPELQHTFCALWNDIVLEAWNEEGPENIPVRILREIRHACIALHQDTGAALMKFSVSTHHFDPVLRQPRSYRVCRIASHRQSLTIPTPFTSSSTAPSFILDQSAASSPHPSPTEGNRTPDGSTAPQPAEEANASPPTTDHTPHPNHMQEFMSAPPAANSVPISQAGSIIGPPVPESIGSVVTRDPDLLVPDEAYEASHDPHQQPALPAAEVAAVATMCGLMTRHLSYRSASWEIYLRFLLTLRPLPHIPTPFQRPFPCPLDNLRLLCLMHVIRGNPPHCLLRCLILRKTMSSRMRPCHVHH